MNNKDMSIEWSAAKIIETNDKKREVSCRERVERVLKQFDCIQIPLVQILGNQIKTNIVYKAISRPSPMGNSDVTGKDEVIQK